MSDERLPPESDPMLREVWADMSPAERLRYMVHEDEPVPEDVSEQALKLFRDRFPKP